MTAPSTQPRRRYSAELKQQILAQCAQPGASVASVARSHGINANVVHKWRSTSQTPASSAPTAPTAAQPHPAFIPLALPTSTAASSSTICIELHRGDTRVTLTWPLAAAADCAAWLRALLP